MNPKIRNISKQLLSDNWYTLNKFSFEYQNDQGEWQTQHREAYDRGNGATVLLYNTEKHTVVLIRQFRMPTYINGNDDGLIIETCAGLLEGDNPADCIRKEIEEETGYRLQNVEKVFESYMSPGAVTEIVHFFVAEYSAADKVSEGGGLEHEQENIEVLEYDFDDALEMIRNQQIKDAKTIMLLQYAKLNNLLNV